MLNRIREIVKRICPAVVNQNIGKFRNKLFNGYATKSYSQEGEDMILRRLFKKQKVGCYVDVGAHHPMRFSNTYFFYKRGWSGINIDAMPGSMKKFSKQRKRDLNIEAAISDNEEYLDYYIFNNPALNSFSKNMSCERFNAKHKIIDIKKIKTQKLANILDEYITNDKEIDFLNIDVEGLDYNVLISNDWQKVRPKVILIESWKKTLEDSDTNLLHFMKSQDYVLFAKTLNTYFFLSKEFYIKRIKS
jgi:FkbM family methyltransferase